MFTRLAEPLIAAAGFQIYDTSIAMGFVINRQSLRLPNQAISASRSFDYKLNTGEKFIESCSKGVESEAIALLYSYRYGF